MPLRMPKTPMMDDGISAIAPLLRKIDLFKGIKIKIIIFVLPLFNFCPDVEKC